MNFPAHGLFLRGEEFGDGSLHFFVVEIVFRCVIMGKTINRKDIQL